MKNPLLKMAGSHRLIRWTARLPFLAVICASTATVAQTELEEITVVGSQIKGANITEALAVSVIDAEEIEIMGVDSGDELFQLIPENGQNFFNEADNVSGGVNAARGDVGAFNLRNIGTGNTLVLLNGRRLVNSATYQSELVGGASVPVNSVNSQTIPVWGVERLEVLRDGASAIYGADAVAGVVNTVLKTDFEGFNVRFKWTEFDNLPRSDQKVTLEWGKYFNEGQTNVSAFVNYYQRDRVNSADDERWVMGDHRELLPEDSPWAGDTAFRSSSANGLFAQFDVVPGLSSSHSLRQNDVVDNAGEFETYPIGSDVCTYNLNEHVCAAEDFSGSPRPRYNLNANRDLASELERASVFVFINHGFDNGMESFTELLGYQSKTELIRHPTSMFSSSELVVGAQNYYNPFGPCGSPNRLPDSIIGDDVPCEGLAMTLDNYRFAELPRIVNNDGETYRILQGFRGNLKGWDFDTAVSWSRATKEDVTRNRVSNTLMQEALNDSTAAAYNPFSAGIDSNIERALIDVSRISETELLTFDVKFSNANIYELPAGSVGMLAGFEWREESFKDDRDPRLDGTIQFVDADGDTYPFVSDVANSSPTPDNGGERQVTSLFGELQIPLFENFDVQLAARFEDFDDIGESATVGKAAFGWRPIDMLLLRGSWSEAYRVPNLVTVNEDVVARTNSGITDWACQYAEDLSGTDLSCTGSIQRIAQGSENLVPEESENTSIGFAFTPTDWLTATFDYWSIEKENTIGLLGQENHTLLDLFYRLQAGTSDCDASFNNALSRSEADDDQIAAAAIAGICPVGDANFVSETYENLNTRNVEGFDVGVYLDFDTDLGRFKFTYNGSFLEKYEQGVSGDSALLLQAQQDGAIPAHYPVVGFSDLINADGNQDDKHSMRLSWRKDAYGASVSAYRLGSFYIQDLTLEDGTRYVVPSMTTYDATFDYRTQIGDTKTRFRLGVKNLTDERAPLTDRFFGFTPDAHNDYGRYAYLDVKVSF